MIYLLQDCYKDDKGEYHDVLKIGFSKDSFSRNRQNQYNTHNFGYKFLGEREGSCELENYLHKLLKEYNLSREWFMYSEEVIDKFWKVSEEDILDFSSQDELNEYIRSYILNHLVPSVNKLKKLYLNQILHEISEKDIGYEEYKETYKRTIIEVFELVSTKEYKYFSDLNFNSSENIEILKKCNLTLLQIVGRQRNRENPFKNNIVIFYKTKRKDDKDLTEEEFDKLQAQRRESTKILLREFNNMSTEGQVEYLGKLKRDSELYVYDFVSISKNTNTPVYNTLIDIANERAWEVSQKDYQDTLTVTKAIQDAGFLEEKYQSQEDIIVSDFLDNYFYKTGIFSDKMKMYCEFCDQYKDNSNIMATLDHKIDDLKYKGYYTFYGTKGCSSRKYQEADLLRGWQGSTLESKLETMIRTQFKVGDRYSMKDIKSILSSLYFQLGISKTAKAKDLENYFKISKTKITMPNKSLENGFKLGIL